MPDLDKTTRQKWPAPTPPPAPEITAQEVEAGRAETSNDSLRGKARAVLALLIADYGIASWPFLDPVSALVEVILSHRTTDPVCWAAFSRLRERWPRWEDVRDADVGAIVYEIHGVTWPEQKAPRIKNVLQEITARQGEMNIDFLKETDLQAANDYLTSLDGVGPKSAACVLLFSCHRPVLPVDTHLHRVSQRLGLIGPKVSADKAHTVLQALLPDPLDAQQVLNMHRAMLLHGQRVCVYSDPKCPKCNLRDWCDYYASHPEKQAEVARAGANARRAPKSV